MSVAIDEQGGGERRVRNIYVASEARQFISLMKARLAGDVSSPEAHGFVVVRARTYKLKRDSLEYRFNLNGRRTKAAPDSITGDLIAMECHK